MKGQEVATISSLHASMASMADLPDSVIYRASNQKSVMPPVAHYLAAMDGGNKAPARDWRSRLD